MVFALNTEEATQFDNLIKGKCKVNSRTWTVLYDSGATHFSFLSLCLLELSVLGLLVCLLVSAPFDNLVKTSHVA